jgi:hypothetical protein
MVQSQAFSVLGNRAIISTSMRSGNSKETLVVSISVLSAKAFLCALGVLIG